jgi:hypothetical protein
MDHKRLGEIVGALVANGVPPTPEAVASVLTDQELLDAVQARNLVLSPVLGSIASEGAVVDVGTNDAETLPTTVTPESLLERVNTAHEGYVDFVTQLNARREALGTKGRESLRVGTAEKLAEELEVWATPERIEYINKVLEADPTLTYTVTATPNDCVSGQEVIDSYRQFGDNQPYRTEVWSNILTRCRYTDKEVSGTSVRNGNDYMLSVRFNKPILLFGDRDAKNHAIAKMQKDNPFLRPTTPLEDEVYVLTLRAEAGGSLKGEELIDATFTMFPQMNSRRRIGGFRNVPYSYVDGGGWRSVGESVVDYVRRVAVVVG